MNAFFKELLPSFEHVVEEKEERKTTKKRRLVRLNNGKVVRE